MENIIEYPPREDNVFPRGDLTDGIYRLLAEGSHVYLAAPRRGGKTTLLYHLLDEAEGHYRYKYLPVANTSDFAQYFEMIQQLRKQAETLDRPMLLLVNEFQQAVETIMRQEGMEMATRFLQRNHELRTQQKLPLKFVLSGSRSLYHLAEKLDSVDTLADLGIVDIPSITREEARDLLHRLLFAEDVAYTDGALEHLLDRIRWYTPFYIQLLAYELIEEYAVNETLVTESQTDKAFNILIHAKNVHFDVYAKRLQELFVNATYSFAFALLHRLAREDYLDHAAIQTVAREHGIGNFAGMLDILQDEGYILCQSCEEEYRCVFSAPMLRYWWRNTINPESASAENPAALSVF